MSVVNLCLYQALWNSKNSILFFISRIIRKSTIYAVA